MLRSLLSLAFFFIAIPGFSQITLECDYASSANRKKPMHYHWDICNRISPINRFNRPADENAGINVVRPLGGKAKGGNKLLDEDTYKWDGKQYYYDWAPLKNQIDNVTEEFRLHQLVTDNPPWAFQRGMEFEGGDAVETYGNAWPPNDPEAWSQYIQAMLQELITSYGREQVEQWRFCVGREIGTPGHWRAGKAAFFEHYRNTVDAIHAVLPDAKVGTHFLWCSSKHPYGPDFVKWCKEHDVHYDFIGVSYYPFYNKIARVDLDYVYRVDFAPIKDIPEWNSDATLEIHEFALITNMNSRGNGFTNASNAHQESFAVMLAKMMYDHDMVDIYRWGSGADKVAEQAFLAMKGNIYYASSKQGTPRSSGNMVDAVFARDELKERYNIMAYNYNANPHSTNSEPVKIVTTIPAPQDSEIKYRSGVYRDHRLEWSGWTTDKSTAGKNATESVATFLTDIPVFSFVRYEIIAGNRPSAGSERR